VVSTASFTWRVAREGGQSVARSVHWRDATGAEIVRALRTAVRDRNVERISARAEQLIMMDGRCSGVLVATDDGSLPGPSHAYVARATLVATGGAGGLWGASTNAAGATADGIALAMHAGAQLADLEFMQFHPTALNVPGAQLPLLTEALRGHGAILVDAGGERFVDELAPRHIVAKAILDRRTAFLDCRAINDFAELFPTVATAAAAFGFDPTREPLPVTPAAHYFIGGVSSDASGRTSIPGLFAAGECASTGMHGANRMAGNSLLETVVVGRRVGEQVAEQPPAPNHFGYARSKRFRLGDPDPRIPGIMWSGVGPIRTDDGLHRAIQELWALPSADTNSRSPHVALCILIATAAKARVESRGVHIRSDFPGHDDAFASRSFDRSGSHVSAVFASTPEQMQDWPLDRSH
jgi:L-aspartate oxidase